MRPSPGELTEAQKRARFVEAIDNKDTMFLGPIGLRPVCPQTTRAGPRVIDELVGLTSAAPVHLDDLSEDFVATFRVGLSD